MVPGLKVFEAGDRPKIEASGDLDLGRWAGRAHIESRAFSAALVEPWIGRGAMARMGAGGSLLDLDADFDLDPTTAGDAVTRGELRWRRGEQQLLAANADLRGLRLSDGRLDPAALAGGVRVSAGLPAGMLEPWLGGDLLADLEAAGTRLDPDVEIARDPIDLCPEIDAGARGRARLAWRRGDSTLLRAAADGPVKGLALRLDLLPAEAGRRQLRGELRAESWAEIDAAEIVAGRAEIELPDLAAALGGLRRRWPRLIPDDETAVALGERQGWPIAGALSATANLAGPVANPEIDGEAVWRRNDSIVHLAATGEPLTTRGEIRVDLEAIDLAGLGGLLTGPEGETPQGRIHDCAGSKGGSTENRRSGWRRVARYLSPGPSSAPTSGSKSRTRPPASVG